MTDAPNLPISMTQRWLLAIRPKTLPAAISPVLAGWACAFRILYSSRGGFDLISALTTLLIAVLIQITANLVNDVSDYQKGADSGRRLGPLRVTQAGLLTPRQMWSAAALLLAAAGLAGLYLVIQKGWPVLLLGAACMAGAVFYSVGRFSFAATGLGDLFAMLFFGFGGVCGTVFVLSGTLSAAAWWSAVPVGLLVSAILVVNNIRDIESDRKAGRMNLAARYGRKAGETEYVLLVAAAYLASFPTAWAAQSAGVLLVWLSLPLAVRLQKEMRAAEISPLFNQYLAQTARLTLIYSVLLAAGILLGIRL